MNAAKLLPEAFMDEDGEVYYAAGHIEPCAFVLACVVATVIDSGPDDAMELLFGPTPTVAEVELVLAGVRHNWYRSLKDPANDEAMEVCAPDADGALAFTEMHL